ncbi:unnamed protein product [Phaedon cochleariae]|uniref:Osiris 20 n=1 Tax=Phaedon cochleariae TaxID=80249 RepID=A0A9N9SC40_PHACE|nr:unnamed protein product [Phaedon cochleariae]
MWRFLLATVALATYVQGLSTPQSGDELVSSVLDNCIDMACVKQNVLGYLDNINGLTSDPRNAKNIDAAIFKRAARFLKTHEFRFKVPEAVLDQTEVIYNPKSGLDILTKETEEESRGLGLKKKLLFPVLLLLKLKMKLLMPLFVALIGLKATKALILSKLAIVIVLGFIVYQFLGKSGMPMPMSMMPLEPPAPLYGVPGPSTAPPSSYEPGWEPNQGGPYQRVWNGNSDAQSMAYSGYYPGTPAATSTNNP